MKIIKLIMELENQWAVVTGASSGIGRELARGLAQKGAHLILVARRKNRLNELSKELIKTFGVKALPLALDLIDPKACETLYQQATAESRKITVLVNNAGIGKYGSFLNFPIQQHLDTIQLNSVVPTWTTYLFIQHMLKHQRPSYILQVSSLAGFQAVSNYSVYSASKFYLRIFSEIVNNELKNTPIHLMCLCPGGVNTEFFDHSHPNQKFTAFGKKTLENPEKLAQATLKALFKKKSVYVPGFTNQLICFLIRFLPRNFAFHLTKKVMNLSIEKPSPFNYSKNHKDTIHK